MNDGSGTSREESGPTDRSGAAPTATDDSELLARLEAVERALTGGDTPVVELDGAAELDARLAAVEERVETLAERADELDAATQALRGYAGGLRAVDEDIERRADAALAKAESLEREFASERQLHVERLDAVTDADGAVSDDSDDPPEGDVAHGVGGVDHGDGGQYDGSSERGGEIGSPEGRDRGRARYGDGGAAPERSDDPDGIGRSLAARLRDVL